MRNNPQIPWNMYVVAGRPDVELDILIYYNMRDDAKIWTHLSCNVHFIRKYLTNNPQGWDLPWVNTLLSTFAPWSVIESNPDYNWDWACASANEELPAKVVIENPERNWSTVSLLENPSIYRDEQLVLNYLQNDTNNSWKLAHIMKNPAITCDFMEKYINYNWGAILSIHPNITWKFVEKHIDKNWNWLDITKNTFGRK